MSIKSKVISGIRFIIDSEFRFCYLAGEGWLGNVPAEKFLKRLYKNKIGRDLNLERPVAKTL